MKLMLNCKQASRIISQSLDTPLPLSDRMKLKFHLFICKACNRFNQQLRLISDVILRIRHDTENDSSIGLSIEAKVRIGHRVNNAIESTGH